MPSGVLDTQLHHHIIDVLTKEYEAAPAPQAGDVADGVPMPVLACAWGLYAQVNRHTKAAIILTDNDMAHEAHVHLRVAMEHAIYLHWIVERGEPGVEIMRADQSARVAKSIKTAREATVILPPEVEKEIKEIGEGIDDGKALKQFRKVCEELDLLGLYFMYGVESGFVHASLQTINAYASPTTLTTEPQRIPSRSTVHLLAQCLIWARRDLDRIVPGRPDAEGLDALAQLIDTRPLPPYRPVATPSSRRRRRGHSKQAVQSLEGTSDPAPGT
jgi:hypothetical protein